MFQAKMKMWCIIYISLSYIVCKYIKFTNWQLNLFIYFKICLHREWVIDVERQVRNIWVISSEQEIFRWDDDDDDVSFVQDQHVRFDINNVDALLLKLISLLSCLSLCSSWVHPRFLVGSMLLIFVFFV